MGLTVQEKAFLGVAIKELRESHTALGEAGRAQDAARARARRIQGIGHDHIVNNWRKATSRREQVVLLTIKAREDVRDLVKVFFWVRAAAQLVWPTEMEQKVRSFIF